MNFGDSVPDRNFDGADSDRALRVATGLFALHHAGEYFFRVEVIASRVQQRLGCGLHDARDQAVAHLGTAGITARGVERKPHHGPTIADNVCGNRHNRGGHLAEVKNSIADG